MEQDNGLAAPGRGRFETTRWSEVLQAAQSHVQGGAEALARLCERYWPSLYAFARYRGNAPEDAQDLVQGFFEHLIESRALATVDQGKGRFRSFLLASFQNFIAMEQRHAKAEKRGGRADLVWIDWQKAEDPSAFEPKDRLTPETLYDARCALELLGRATLRLEQEQAMQGNAEAFRTLRAFLGNEGTRAELSYEAAARALNVGLPTVRTMIYRLRRRQAHLLREEVAQTVLDAKDVADEVHALCEALIEAGGQVRA